MEISQEARADDPWPGYFAGRGHPGALRIGSGAEGVVYRLGLGRVAKVWAGRPPIELTRRVYADLARRRLPFATPEIFEVVEHEGVLVTYERELPGAPMGRDHPEEEFGRELPAHHADALLTVLRGLASVPGTDAMRRLTFQGDDRPLWQGHDRFQDALAALVGRAVARNGDALAALVERTAGRPGAAPAARVRDYGAAPASRAPDFGAGVKRTLDALRSLPTGPVTAIHGDLVPPNIHVDAAGRPVAVLDFGFCTTAGDPAFEAAVTAAFWDMYGPYAEEHATELTRLFADRLGHPPETLAVYQAVYALISYDLFGMGADDGHFRWCAALLRRNLVFTAS
ncbi:aminoglycoside phosphotransferase family protein [Nonomuraea fuscirosea]|uniref:phosphotransferase family protein n=1 Tax=Nonomuraea fuscirosea TaxID=1291556 RepID=UPI002DD8AE59|nr:aminoglycoside phosphotransferase family protein [Nonomuraea fuscirosea]WSA55749.1 aminoglycoside phosphotransferase family protein [Nonomuraea fuscirosea]